MNSEQMEDEMYILVASNRAPNVATIKTCVKPSTLIYVYNYETASLNDILVGVHRQVARRKMQGVGLLLHSTQTSLLVSAAGQAEEIVISDVTAASDASVRSFLLHLVQSHLQVPAGRLDVFNACLTTNVARNVVQSLQSLLKVPVQIWGDHMGGPLKIGKLYFQIDELNEKIKNPSDGKLDGYEKIRAVGKGAFGTAVLYQNTATDTPVVIKEINMMELTSSERQMALNEVQVLSVLNHPNIVSYYRSFERDGILMIEMEYADGGTLAQMLARLTRPLPEREIVTMFQQITSAIRHMHQHNILHRDLKAANVFLTKDNKIKVGDFGISKAMTTRQQAQTVLGTPYYISPEMCEGKQYDQKSDIWALGCILYEMACLKKPFQGSSLPALVNSIMKGSYQPLPATYSASLRHLVSQILQREPHKRPSAGELLEVMIPRTFDLLARQDTQTSISSINRSSKERSVLYDISGFGTMFSLHPIPLPLQIKIVQVAVSDSHYIVLTSELTVLTWGSGEHGQLGTADTPQWRSTPAPVPALAEHAVRAVAAGTGFSAFVSDHGMVLTCGHAANGCLGHADAVNLNKPKLIEKLLQVDVASISCGADHVAALAADGNLYTWGLGEGGRTGLGYERTVYVPTVVDVISRSDRLVLRSIHCGMDGTIVVTSSGTLYACGRNTFNKIGLNSRGFFFGQQVVDESLTFQRVTSVREAIVDVSMGADHTCLLTAQDSIITMGRNLENQLGHSAHHADQAMATNDYVINLVTAGPTYTAAVTIENVVLVWGTVKQQADSLPPTLPQKSSLYFNTATEVLALYASPAQIQAGNSINIAAIHGTSRGLFLVVNTTAPVARIPTSDSQVGHNEGKRRDPDTDSIGPVPEWMKADMADSEAAWNGYTSSFTNNFSH